MAHFSPALNLDTDVPGEIEFFKRLKNDPSTENWWVLHSYYLSEHIKQKEGEIDFIVFIPNKGIVVVEVNGMVVSGVVANGMVVRVVCFPFCCVIQAATI